MFIKKKRLDFLVKKILFFDVCIYIDICVCVCFFQQQQAQKMDYRRTRQH